MRLSSREAGLCECVDCKSAQSLFCSILLRILVSYCCCAPLALTKRNSQIRSDIILFVNMQSCYADSRRIDSSSRYLTKVKAKAKNAAAATAAI